MKTYFTITRVSNYNVYESHDPSCQLMKCHAVTTLLSTSFAATKKQDGKNDLPIISAYLVEIKKKRGKLSYHLTCACEDWGCFPLCQRFLKFRSEVKWKGSFWFLPTTIFRITARGGPLILVAPVWPKFAVPFLTKRFTALLASLHLRREFGKGIKNGKRPIPLGWPGLIGKCCSTFLGYWHNRSTSHVINTILGHYACFWIFWRESFEACKKKFAALGSGSQAHKIASPWANQGYLKCPDSQSVRQ